MVSGLVHETCNTTVKVTNYVFSVDINQATLVHILNLQLCIWVFHFPNAYTLSVEDYYDNGMIGGFQ